MCVCVVGLRASRTSAVLFRRKRDESKPLENYHNKSVGKTNQKKRGGEDPRIGISGSTQSHYITQITFPVPSLQHNSLSDTRASAESLCLGFKFSLKPYHMLK